MNVIETTLPGVVILEPKVWEDPRGFFFEAYNQRTFANAGITERFVQDNQSRSRRGTLRGMHFQAVPHAQAKLVRVLSGVIYDVVVDLGQHGGTPGKWEGFELSADQHRSLLVPRGFAHGFCVLSDDAEVLYKCSDFYDPPSERGFRWDDPDVGIEWPVDDPVLSKRDREHPRFRDILERQ